MIKATTPSDLRLNPNPTDNVYLSPIIMDEYDMLIQEIDILFSTDYNEVLNGGINWANLKDYVFRSNISENTLQEKLQKYIYEECPSAENKNISVDVKFVRGSLNDIGIITVTIKDDAETVINSKDYLIG